MSESMTIMDKINQLAIKLGVTPITGSIVDCLNNIITAKGGTPVSGTIADAVKRFMEITTINPWKISVRMAPGIQSAVGAANNAKAMVNYDADQFEIIITVDISELQEYTSDAEGQGTHKWLGIGIDTGAPDLTLVKYGGTQLTSDDIAEARGFGLDKPGEFILWIAADVVAVSDKTITLTGMDSGAPAVTITIKVVAPDPILTE